MEASGRLGGPSERLCEARRRLGEARRRLIEAGRRLIEARRRLTETGRRVIDARRRQGSLCDISELRGGVAVVREASWNAEPVA